MTELLQRADDVLRRRPLWIAGRPAGLPSLILLIGLFGPLYGAAMGSYGGLGQSYGLQMVYAGLKVPLLLLATFTLSLPSFFVFNSLLGLRRDLAEAIWALLATQAGVAVILASLAPLTLVWYASVDGYYAAILFNIAMFSVASLSAQRILRSYFRHLIERNPRHRVMLHAWLGIYAFVGIQMGWVLRPFIGDPQSTVQFFRSESWGNAYVVVINLIVNMLRW